MSYIRLPKKSEGRLPSIPSDSDEEIPRPIESTAWKCRRQVMGTLIVCLGVFGVGTVFGWAAIAVPQLRDAHKIHKDESSEALVASIFIIGAMFAGPLAGYAMFKLGRQMATFYFALLFLIGWIFLPAAQFIDDLHACEAMLCIGRFVTGFAGAGCLVIGPVYVREMSDEGIRTVLGSMVPLILVLGNTLVFAFGVLISWWVMSIICCFFPALLCCLILFVPNTPRHLLTIGKEAEAKKAMYWLTHGFTPEEQERMFKKVKRGVEFLNKNSNKAMKRADRKQKERRLRLRLKSRPVLHPLIISIILIFFQQGSGTNVVATYTTDILKKGKKFISVDAGTAMIGINYFLSVIVATLVVERLGRKPLLLGGSMMMCISQVILGIFFYYHHLAEHDEEYKEKYPNALEDIETNFSWIPIFCTNVFIAFYALGLGSVTWIIATEINHPDFQEIAGTLDSFTYWMTAFLSSVTVPSLRTAIHYHWCFWIYAIMSFLAFWYCLFFIYETKGKTQDDIMAHYRGHIYNLEDEDEDGDVKSIGSVSSNVRKMHPNRPSGHRRYRASGDSTASDWETDLETLFETGEHEDLDVSKS